MSGPAGGVVWLDGRVHEADDALVRALDHGVTVGDGFFETMKVVGGEPFALARHLVRLHRSAKVLGLVPSLSDDGLRAACAEAISGLAERGGEPGRVRITVTGGPGPLGSNRDEVPTTVMVAVSGASTWAPTSSVVTVAWVRNERSATAGAKTTSYAENVVALAHAHRHGADEAIFANTVGQLCEGTGSNLFVASGGVLRTPSLATGCLAGITRELLLEVVAGEETAALTLDDLRSADEAFLTSSTRDVHPIALVDGRPLAGGATPGPLSVAAAAAFAALEARTPDP